MVAVTALIDSAGETFERLFADEYRRVVSIAFRITGDAAEAEDVAQEAFMRCGRSRVADAAKARNWLYIAAAHLALNAVRARRRRLYREEREYRSTHEAPSADPQLIVEQRDERMRVRAALARIGARHAEILALRYSGLSYREIGAALAIDATQVGTRLARAERAFKREIERETLG
jgi:RNA polymerase sigma-70 factor (ECF subfamily)